jgi:hypothetical protein
LSSVALVPSPNGDALMAPIRALIADSDGTSLYPLMYSSLLCSLDMLLLLSTLIGAAEEGFGVADRTPKSSVSTLRSLVPENGGAEEVDRDRIIALGGSFSRPEGEAMIEAGPETECDAASTASLGLDGAGDSGLALGLGAEERSMLPEEAGWVDRGPG